MQDGLAARSWRIRAVVGLLVLVGMALSPLLGAGFLNWDDNIWIGQNSAIVPGAGGAWEGLKERWTGPLQRLYTPLTHTVWFGVGRLAQKGEGSGLGGLDAGVFHAANVGVHLVGVVFVWLLVRRVLGMAAGRDVSAGADLHGRDARDTTGVFLRGNDSSQLVELAALIAAGVFGLHPVMVEAVGWVSGLKDVLCGTLLAGGLWWAAGVGARVSAGERWRWSWLLVWVGWVLAAALAKPTGVMLAPMALVMVWGVFGVRAWRPLGVAMVSAGVCVVPLMVLAGRWQPPVAGLPNNVTGVWRAAVALDAVGFYVRKVVWPDEFCVDYGRPGAVVVREGWWVWYGLVAVGCGMLAWVSARFFGDRVVRVGAALFVLPLVPVLGLKDFNYMAVSVVADHYAYPAMIGTALIVGRMMFASVGRWKGAGWVGMAVCLVLAGLAFREARAWKDDESVMGGGLKVNPKSVVMNTNYGAWLRGVGRVEEAEKHLLTAIEVWPGYPVASMNLGIIAAGRGEYQKALRYYRDAAPGVINKDASYHRFVAEAYLGMERPDRAEPQLREAVRLEPGDSATRAKLAEVQAILQQRAATQAATRAATQSSTSPSER